MCDVFNKGNTRKHDQHCAALSELTCDLNDCKRTESRGFVLEKNLELPLLYFFEPLNQEAAHIYGVMAAAPI